MLKEFDLEFQCTNVRHEDSSQASQRYSNSAVRQSSSVMKTLLDLILLPLLLQL